jgi:hypothetical protein
VIHPLSDDRLKIAGTEPGSVILEPKAAGNRNGVLMASVRSFSNWFFATGLVMAVCAAAAFHSSGRIGDVQLTLAVLMAAAGCYLRTGTAAALIAGLAAAGITVAAGITLFLIDGMYVLGTFMAIVLVFRIATLVLELRRAPAVAPSRLTIPWDGPRY